MFTGVLVNIVMSFRFTERPKSENLAGALWCRAPLKVQSSQRTVGADLLLEGPRNFSYCSMNGHMNEKLLELGYSVDEK